MLSNSASVNDNQHIDFLKGYAPANKMHFGGGRDEFRTWQA